MSMRKKIDWNYAIKYVRESGVDADWLADTVADALGIPRQLKAAPSAWHTLVDGRLTPQILVDAARTYGEA